MLLKDAPGGSVLPSSWVLLLQPPLSWFQSFQPILNLLQGFVPLVRSSSVDVHPKGVGWGLDLGSGRLFNFFHTKLGKPWTGAVHILLANVELL